MFLRFLVLIAVLLLMSASVSAACGSIGPACSIGLGNYRIALPDGPAPRGGHPALLFFHGAGGSGAGTLKMIGMVETFTRAGWAVIAPDGLKRPNSRFGPGWSFHPARPKHPDGPGITKAMLVDAALRQGINRDRVLMSGFSIGGALVWYLACEDPSLATAYAPIGGAFWRPHPEEGSCAGPVRLFHTHGWRDGTVPLEGRPLRSADILQGDVFHGLTLLRQANGCTGLKADQFETDGLYWRRAWTDCRAGSALELALHPGGHSIPKGWAAMALEWFETRAEGLVEN